MSETSFSITFSDSTTAVDCNYWIRLEVVKQEDDTVTLSEVADIVDAAFDVNVCGVEDPPTEEDPVSTEELIEGINEPPQTVDFAALFQYIYGLSDYDPCKVNPATGKYEAQVRMYLSHPHDLEYKFIAENGEVLSTIITSESVDGNIEVSGNSITLEKPIASEVTASVTIKEILGSTVYFEEEIEGSVHFSYQSQHYLITVEVPASENFEETGEAGKCKCLGFFHGCVDEIILTPPEDDELTTELLGCDWGIETETTPSVVTCYEAVTIREKCECSGSTASEEIVEMDIPCPEGSNYTCPQGYDTCRKLMGSRTEVSYVDCGETTGDINTAAFYEEKCCVPPPFALPKCSKVTRNYYGGKGIEGGEALYRGLYGDNTRFIPVGPQNGVCGELTIEQRLIPLNCCEGATAPVFTIAPVDVEHGHNYLFCVSGGSPPFSWSVEAESGGLSISGSGSCARLYVSDCFCKSGIITVTDVCNMQVQTTVDGVDGWWEEITEAEFGPGTPIEANVLTGSTTYQIYQNDDWKAQQIWVFNGSSTGSSCGRPDIVDSVGWEDFVKVFPDLSQPASYYFPGFDTSGATHPWRAWAGGDPANGVGAHIICPPEWGYPGWQGYAYGYPSSYLGNYYYTFWKWTCGIDEFIYDEENSAEVIADSSYGIVLVTGGKVPFTWAIVGTGFWLDAAYTKKTLETTSRSCRICTEDACGVCDIVCIDACGTEVTGIVTSTDGNWVIVAPRDYCVEGSFTTQIIFGNLTEFVFTKGDKKQRIWINIQTPLLCKDYPWCIDDAYLGIYPVCPGGDGFNCWCVTQHWDYEWRC